MGDEKDDDDSNSDKSEENYKTYFIIYKILIR